MTLSELVASLERPEKRSTVAERLRHWSDLDLLKPAGEARPGTGRARSYGADALRQAKIIFMLADLGIPVTGKPELVRRVLKSKRLQRAAAELATPTDG